MSRFPIPIMILAAAAMSQAQTIPLDLSTLAAQACTDASGASLPQCAGSLTPTLGSIPRLPPVKSHGISPVKADRLAEERERPETSRVDVLPPEPPTEFQQFIAASTGKVLPLAGAELFEKALSAFVPVDKIPVTANYVLGPGDELLVRTWGQVNMNLELTVDRTGAVFLPQVGNVTVAGIAFSQSQGFLRSQLGRVYRNFELSVTMGQLRSVQVLIMGQARRPGVCTVSALSTLVNALFACGGPSAQGSMRRIQLKRDGKPAAELDIYGLLLSGDRGQDARLMPGDVIYIDGTGPQVAIAGSVPRPAIYELRGGETVEDLVAMAGGFTPVADRRKVKIERVAEGSRAAIDLATDQPGLATRLSNGDLVQVAAVAASFSNTVTLRGNVANPGRFAWHPGLRLRDIIPDKDSLVTRSYWERHNLLGYTAVKYAPATETEGSAPSLSQSHIGSLVPAINWSYAVIERRKSSDLSIQLVPFHPGRLVLDGDQRENHELQPGDVVTIFSQQDLRVPITQQSRQVRLEGELRAPGVYEVADGETLGHLVQRAGGLTPDAYLYGAVLTRESARREQQERMEQYSHDLERDIRNVSGRRETGSPGSDDAALANLRLDGLQKITERLRTTKASGRIALGFSAEETSIEKLMGIAVEDGDQFIVPIRPSTVYVLGAVYNTGALLHQQQWRVREYLKRAGGSTRAADRSRVYLIRADGTVVSKQNFGHFGPSFEMTNVYPGDSVIVPETLPKQSLLRNLRDWTQMSSQMALGAAAVNVLK